MCRRILSQNTKQNETNHIILEYQMLKLDWVGYRKRKVYVRSRRVGRGCVGGTSKELEGEVGR